MSLLLIRLFGLAGGLLLIASALGQDDPIALTWRPDDSLRGLAEIHLGDPDAWPEILRANQLDSADQLRPGMALRIPAKAIRELDRALRELRALIYRATHAGAQVFATETIAQAMRDQAAALEARRRGALDEAVDLARSGIAAARTALETSRRDRDVAAEAVLQEAGGTVQRRRPSEFDWTAIAIKTLLAERERLRTLAASFAVVRFRDASSVRMSEHAQLAIRRIRRDRLTRREAVDLVLYTGDVRALIAPGAARQSVAVAVPGIETRVRSNHYWLQKTPDRTRLANYDGEIQVSVGGDTVAVRRNQGTLVERDRPPLAPVDLLPSPELKGPPDGKVLFDMGVGFRWEAETDAVGYWLEVALDRDFARLLFTMTAIEETHYYLPIAEEGLYYWRVSAIDASGLPGPASDSRRLRLRWDQTPPYLVLEAPPEGHLSREPRVAVAGRTESGASLMLNGEPIQVGHDGRFAVEQPLDEGANELLLEARDPAGNLSRVERILHFSQTQRLPLELAQGLPRDAQGRLVVNRPRFTLRGSTLAGSRIRLQSLEPPGFGASAVADAEGGFSLTVPAAVGVSQLMLEGQGPLGQRVQRRLEVVLDTTAPLIHLDSAPPDRTSDPMLLLAGQVEGASRLIAGTRPVALSPEGRFGLEVPLESGPNLILLEARDQVGNQRLWQETVVLDQDPPGLVGHRLIGRGTSGASGVLEVEIRAQDATGVVAAIPYRLEVQGDTHLGVARRCADRTCHRDRVLLQPAAIQSARLRSLVLEDYLGNRREVELD